MYLEDDTRHRAHTAQRGNVCSCRRANLRECLNASPGFAPSCRPYPRARRRGRRSGSMRRFCPGSAHCPARPGMVHVFRDLVVFIIVYPQPNTRGRVNWPQVLFDQRITEEKDLMAKTCRFQPLPKKFLFNRANCRTFAPSMAAERFPACSGAVPCWAPLQEVTWPGQVVGCIREVK